MKNNNQAKNLTFWKGRVPDRYPHKMPPFICPLPYNLK